MERETQERIKRCVSESVSAVKQLWLNHTWKLTREPDRTCFRIGPLSKDGKLENLCTDSIFSTA